MSDDKDHFVHDLAAEHLGLSSADSEAYRTIGSALRQIADEGMDIGIGIGTADFWITIAGAEYFITARRSNRQLKQDGGVA